MTTDEKALARSRRRQYRRSKEEFLKRLEALGNTHMSTLKKTYGEAYPEAKVIPGDRDQLITDILTKEFGEGVVQRHQEILAKGELRTQREAEKEAKAQERQKAKEQGAKKSKKASKAKRAEVGAALALKGAEAAADLLDDEEEDFEDEDFEEDLDSEEEDLEETLDDEEEAWK